GDLGAHVPGAEPVVGGVGPMPLAVVAGLRRAAAVELLQGVPAPEQPRDHRGVLAALGIGEPEPVVLGDAAKLAVVRWPNGHGASLPRSPGESETAKVGVAPVKCQ